MYQQDNSNKSESLDGLTNNQEREEDNSITKPRNYGATSTTTTTTTATDTTAILPAGDSEGSSSGSSTPEHMKSTLSFIQKFGFGLGHVYNDLCAGVWFSYTLLFMQGSLLMPAPEAGTLVMLGQVSDAISTPIVGLLADRYGTKRKWHIFGTALVFVTFPMIFSICPWCTTAPHWWQPTYFAIFIVFFQFAWAVVQITHLAMIPEMSRTTKDRSDLTATRYSASVCSNVVVYIITWAVLQGRDKLDDNNNNIGPSDAYRFRDISLILTLFGLSMSVLFQFSLSLSGYEQRRVLSLATQRLAHQQPQSSSSSAERTEEYRNRENDRNDISSSVTIAPSSSSSSSVRIVHSETERLLPQNNDTEIIASKKNLSDDPENKPMNIKAQQYKNFLKSPLLYQNAFLYVFSRLFMTTSLLYMPLWLDERSWHSSNIAQMGTNDVMDQPSQTIDHIATVPLVSFLASFIASMGLKHMTRFCGHQLSYLVGSIISIIACTWVGFGTPISASTLKLFSIAILFGAGSSITMISSLCITADMIGNHTYQGGFIYSAVTFADKLITGIVVVIIETLKCKNRSDCPEYYRNVLAYACGVAAILGLLTLSTLRCCKSEENSTDNISNNNRRRSS